MVWRIGVVVVGIAALIVGGGHVTDGRSSRAAPRPVVATLLAAGDIADCGSDGDERTAALLDRTRGTIVTLGDNAYPDGTAGQFADCYAPTWGRHKARTRPAPGNHDYNTPDAVPYFAYFGRAAGPPGRGYYSFELGTWHIVSLNSERDTGEAGHQAAWLRADLARSRARCVLAFWHKPRWTAGRYDDLGESTLLYELLYRAGAELVLTGHDHNYQRYRPLDPSGTRDPARGLRQFVVGTGGRGPYALRPDARRVTGSVAWGVLRLTLNPRSYLWRFLPVAGESYADAGSGTCH